MKRNTSILIALAVLIGSGIIHGVWAERWTSSTVLQDAAARVAKVPLEIGDWKGESVEADKEAFAQAGAQQFWTRTYVHAHRKEAMLVILMCGRAGRMAVHTPEVCYRGAGYVLGGKPEVQTVRSEFGEDLGSFWTARFSKQTGVASDLRLYWSWNAHGTWNASANPRWEHGGEPFLYKLYMSHDAPGAASASTEAAQDFMREFLPELHKVLFNQNLPSAVSGAAKAFAGAPPHGTPQAGAD